MRMLIGVETVERRRAARRDPYAYLSAGWPDSLERRWFHKALLAINAPAGWPAWLFGLTLALAGAFLCALWWAAASPAWALRIAILFGLLLAADGLILRSLPRLRISFGRVQPQLFILFIPRAAVLAAGGILALWLPPALAFAAAALVNLAAGGALAWGALVEPRRPMLTELSLALDALPNGPAPVRVLHISDLHIERLGRREDELTRMVHSLSPDLILLTGDYVNLSSVDDPAAHAHARRLLAQLSAPAGVFAVLGSPPVDRNSAPDFDGLAHIRLLRDEVATLDLGEGRRITLLGLDCSHDVKTDAEQLARLASQAPADAPRILMYHSPDLAPMAPQHDIDLYLCGHTHGGQVRLPFYGALITSSRLGKRFEMGHYQVGRTHLYVSRGIGLEGLGAPRVRFLCRPEITLFSLSGPAHR